MKKRNVASLAVVPALLLLSGCGAGSGDEYIGEWSSPEEKSGRLEITRQGGSTFTVEQAPGGSGSPGFSAVAALNDDGILVVEVGGGNVPMIIDEASGRLTFNRQEYIRFLRLFEAADEGDTAVVKALLEAGAEVDAKCPDQSYCGRLGMDNRNPDEPLVETFGATALVIAAANGHADAVKALLDAGANVDATTSNGATALIAAAFAKGGGDAVKALLEAGADVGVKGPKGVTALLLAAWRGDADAVKALLEAGADVDATTSNGATALLIAVQRGDAAKALLEAEGLSGETVQVLLGPMFFRDCDACPEMVAVPAGTFAMGAPDSDYLSLRSRARPVHEVTIAAQFAMGVYEVTFAEWDACVAAGGCGGYRPDESYRPDEKGWGRGDRPVINVSWDDAKRYVEWLSGKTGETYRLPSESEWEYAARAGTRTKYSWGNNVGSNRAQCRDCGTEWDGKTAPVGSFGANAWGLHDMHGNAGEWTQDCHNRYYTGAPSDGSAWESGSCSVRMWRGGSWNSSRRYDGLRAAYRDFRATGDRNFNVGFRVARTVAP